MGMVDGAGNANVENVARDQQVIQAGYQARKAEGRLTIAPKQTAEQRLHAYEAWINEFDTDITSCIRVVLNCAVCRWLEAQALQCVFSLRSLFYLPSDKKKEPFFRNGDITIIPINGSTSTWPMMR